MNLRLNIFSSQNLSSFQARVKCESKLGFFLIVDGYWSNWGSWAPCSRTCGPGRTWRTRDCDNPPPSNGGAFCTGQAFQLGSCNNGTCPVELLSCEAIERFLIDALKTPSQTCRNGQSNKRMYPKKPTRTRAV